jgi:type III secretion protein V
VRTPLRAHLALEPDIAQEIVQAVKNECGHLPPTAQRPVMLTSMDIRRYVRKLLEYEFNPPFSVVSYQELSSRAQHSAGRAHQPSNTPGSSRAPRA